LPSDPPALPYRPCAGVVLINAAGQVFAGERIDMPGAYQMPQGGIDPGELPRQAALRELEEETSVPAGAVEILAESADWVRYDLPDHLMGKMWKGKFRGQEQKWLLCRLVVGEQVIDLGTEHAEFSSWTWMRAADLTAQIVPFKRDLYETVLGEFQGWLA